MVEGIDRSTLPAINTAVIDAVYEKLLIVSEKDADGKQAQEGVGNSERMGKGLPLVMADPEALKRALGNLIDNAAEAMQSSLLRELRITTAQLENGMVELTVAEPA